MGLISRGEAYKILCEEYPLLQREYLKRVIDKVPSAESLTDAEQRIFLKAMSREEEVCKIVDEVYKDEGYTLNLVHACQEIIRKVKGALWT